MVDKGEITGRCLCGGVTFRARVPALDLTACHCGMCRRWSGGIALFLPETTEPSFTGEEKIAVYRSSELGERAFCRVCGANLYWRLAGKARYVMCAGAVDQQEGLRLKTEIFVEDKPHYYSFANPTEKHAGEEAMAEFMARANKD